MVNSTEITRKIVEDNKMKKYYAIFLNAMATLAKNFDAKVIKNVGDALLFYFPETSNSGNIVAFREVFECCTTIIAAREFINVRLNAEGLPPVSYRISLEYGRVEVATNVTSGVDDLFGPTVSMCAKINSYADPNGIVIGGDLYQIVKQLCLEKDYEFKEVNKWSEGVKYSYPVYSVTRKDKESSSSATDIVLNIFRRRVDDNNIIIRDEESLVSYASPFCLPSLSNLDKMNIKRHFAIMIVDDEPDILETFKAYLCNEDYQVDAFSDSYHALVSFANSKPGFYDLVILDIRMPTINGLQLYQRLKTLDPSVRVIFLSALDATDELVSILEGVKSVDVLRKPIDKKHFLQKVKSIIHPALSKPTV
jgi:CheY-like chemotaxis protein